MLAVILLVVSCRSSTSPLSSTNGGTRASTSTTGGGSTSASTSSTGAATTTGSTSGTGGNSSTTSGTSSTGGTTGPTTFLATGQVLTPTAAPGSTFQPLIPGLTDAPSYTAGQAVSTVISPDSDTMLVLTSGYNLLYNAQGTFLPDDSEEYVFVYDISYTDYGMSGAWHVPKQVLKVPNTFVGIAFSPDGSRFYAGGGRDDDVHAYALSDGGWSEVNGAAGGPFAKLNHVCGNTLVAPGSIGGATAFCQSVAPSGTAGLAVTANGSLLVVTNHENDSISVVDLSTGAVTDLDLRPGKSNASQAGVPGGEYPFWVAIKGSTVAYVSSLRDREIVVVNLSGTASVATRIAVNGNPNKMILNADQSRLYVACDNSDVVTVIDTSANTVIETISTVAPPGTLSSGDEYPGASPNSLALSPDENTLYVTNGALNAVAVINLAPGTSHQVVGLIPTGWYPHSVSVGNDGGMLYVVNGKSVPGPNPCNKLVTYTCPTYDNPYVLQLQKAGLLSMPVPTADQLATLTQVAVANSFLGAASTASDEQLFATLRQNIKHVIYIVKENRTYDQVLGDLDAGNGDPTLTEFPQATTPNQHALATNFVTLDDFYDPGDVSVDGWAWSTAAREVDICDKSVPVVYAERGYTGDLLGQDRDVDVGLGDPAARLAADPLLKYNPDPDLLPGIGDVSAPDAPPNAQGIFDGGYQQGHLWDSALRAGLTVRNYGFAIDGLRYSQGVGYIPPYTNPANTDGGTTVAYAVESALAPLTDPYYRSLDFALPEFFREKEWEREFDGYVDAGTLPNLELVRLGNDHTGGFSTALYGVNTPELQVADNDYAVGKLVEKVAASPYASSTLIFIVEDDAQTGPDHVDAHRSIAFIVGPYVKQGAVVSTRYSTINMIRTMEDVLGMQHLNVFDAYQPPMSDVFDLRQTKWSFTATPSALLSGTTLPLTAMLDKLLLRPHLFRPTHSASYWAAVTKGMDFSVADHVDAARYNRILWKGLMSARPYPTLREGRDLRLNRDVILKQAKKKNRLIVADGRAGDPAVGNDLGQANP